ncbi:hypothetical protein BGZ83_009522 [Gryganskiella cystojenkinii]|nr:hypothetical protein BGZ83_009522 [Gryganskiella cystojenkinii]
MNYTITTIAPRDDGSFPGTGSGAELSPSTVWFSGVFAFIATMVSTFAIWLQLKNYRKPMLQRYTVRILCMVPVYSLSSWVSLTSLDAAFYIDAFRDVYEAFVIYCFFNLLVYYLGGERSLLTMLHGRPYSQHVFPVSLWAREVDVGDPYTFLFIKRGILQYVYIKPLTAALTMVLKSLGAYHEGLISLKSGYLWMVLISNVSVFLSLYCFTIAVLVATGLLHYSSPEIAVAFQDALICFEMAIASFGHLYAFSHKDYIDPEIPSARMPIYYALRDAFGIRDIIEDSRETLQGTRFTYRTFEPSDGVATVGRSRSGRIMAGLRYSSGGASKYWLPLHASKADRTQESMQGLVEEYDLDMTDGPINLHTGKRGAGRGDGETISLKFSDVDSQDGDSLEELFHDSKKLPYGDYNFPAIDVYDPNQDRSHDDQDGSCQSGDTSASASEAANTATRTLEGLEGLRAALGQDTYSFISSSASTHGDFMSNNFNRTVRPSISTQSLFSDASYSTAPSTMVASDASTGRSNGHGSVVVRDGCVENVNGFVPPAKIPKWKLRGLRGESGKDLMSGTFNSSKH